MGKFFLFSLIWWITGNPIFAVLILLAIVYLLDRRYVGLFPSITRPFALNRRLARAKQDIRARPFDISAKQEAASILVEKKRYKEALPLLQDVVARRDDSAEAFCDLGICECKLGNTNDGERHLQRALELNPRIRYGEPYLRLAEAFVRTDSGKALEALEQFRALNSSSCESYYRLGQIYEKLERKQQAKEAYREAAVVYRALPAYKRKTERRWALLSLLRRNVV
ncbi:tetratricopeptide repeat protein [Paenibacillus thermotolerans]|uniref:tetratricopeptide repeat protein n=1 Tax=Paenibacillus thermotolerans TaxID=3027807 RepID=UPI002368746D|nr:MULTISPECIES: tetratricopeptide repeat protein [unclassified Paenibacillus]